MFFYKNLKNLNANLLGFAKLLQIASNFAPKFFFAVLKLPAYTFEIYC